MSFKPIQKLAVTRTLSSGEQVAVGVLAQNRKGVFFQYADRYLQQLGNLSPFTLHANAQVQVAPKQPHQGVHGVFGDWGPRDFASKYCKNRRRPRHPWAAGGY